MKSLIKRLAKASITYTKALAGFPLMVRKQGNIWVVMYHRVLPSDSKEYASEEPGMVVTPETLEMHFILFRKHFDIVPLDEVLTQTSTKQKDKPRLVITFDDGWLDNFTYALPLIKKHRIPVTLYAVTNMLGHKAHFWPNRVSALLKTRGLDYVLKLFSIQKNEAMQNTQFREQSSAVIKQLKQLSDSEILEKLGPPSSDGDENSNLDRLMDWEQLKEMHATGLVSVGSHTCNHLRLNKQLNKDIAISEIRDSKNKLEKKLGTTIKHFCYPNGDMCPHAVEFVNSLYSSAVTTQSGINKVNDQEFSLLRLKRVGLFEDVSSTTMKLKARLTIF